MKFSIIFGFTFTLLSLNSFAQTQFDVGSDGSDGVLHITEDTTIFLGLAKTGTWDMPSPIGPVSGVFDPDKWIIVYKYESVHIESGATLTFDNHPSGPPVMWLVEGDVVIDGVIDISGQDGGTDEEPPFFAEPGPGGFRGGHRATASGPPAHGEGPGGTHTPLEEDQAGAPGTWEETNKRFGTGGSYGSLSNKLGGDPGITYGNTSIFPLIGGSGGEGGYRLSDTGGGGAGGGAILIASNGTIEINGTINANGGEGYRFAGSGSGGAIKLIANRIEGSGLLTAVGPPNWDGKAGDGRIRIETNQNFLQTDSIPSYSAGNINTPLKLVQDQQTPSVEITSMLFKEVPNIPSAKLAFPNVDLYHDLDTYGASTSGAFGTLPVFLEIETNNIPTSATITIQVVQKGKKHEYVEFDDYAFLIEGDKSHGIWNADFNVFPETHFSVQAYAEWD